MAAKDKTLRLVSGFLIRNTLDDDFGIIHQSSDHLSWFAPKFYIPPSEVWLDYRYQSEKDFLLAVEDFDVTSFASSKGLSHKEERKFILEKLGSTGTPPDFVKKVELMDKFKIIDVDGGLVRRFLDPGFILGGHDLVYEYISENQIWLDAAIDPAERHYILHHELVEHELMAQGKAYDSAHEFATAADKELRRLDGATYPGDDDRPYQWRDLSNEQIINKFYVNPTS